MKGQRQSHQKVLNVLLCKRVNTLPNRRNLVIGSAMQGLCLDNNKREETMNGYFTNTANGDIVQSPVSLEPTKKTLNRASPTIESLPFPSFGEQSLFVGWIYFNNWLGMILVGYHLYRLCNSLCSSGVSTLKFVGSLFSGFRSLWWIIKLVIGCFNPSPSEILSRRLMIVSLSADVSSDILITSSNMNYNTSYVTCQQIGGANRYGKEFRNKLFVDRCSPV